MSIPPTLALLAAPKGAGPRLGAVLPDSRPGFMRRGPRHAQRDN